MHMHIIIYTYKCISIYNNMQNILFHRQCARMRGSLRAYSNILTDDKITNANTTLPAITGAST